MISSLLSVPVPSVSALLSDLLNFILPTGERSYLSEEKNKFSNKFSADSFVGGSPGLIIL